MKTIIATTDFSRAAHNALVFAAALARDMQAKLILFNAYNPAIPTAPAPLALPAIEELLAENAARLQAVGERIAKQHDVEVECQTTTGILKEELDKLVNRRRADLVIMGMRGASLSRSLFGSITTAVLYHAHYPVLVVPEYASYQGLCRILFAHQYKYLLQAHQLDLLADIARTYNAQIQLLHVESLEEEPELWGGTATEKGATMEQLLRGIRHSYKFIRDDDVVKGIERGIAESEADLLVMVPHKADFWDTVLNRSNTRKMALHTSIPLLALPSLLPIKHTPDKAQGKKANSVE